MFGIGRNSIDVGATGNEFADAGGGITDGIRLGMRASGRLLPGRIEAGGGRTDADWAREGGGRTDGGATGTACDCTPG
ncbi:MAG: hypothetical protein ABI551_22835, partial [Polyangiaceae bacterium]